MHISLHDEVSTFLVQVMNKGPAIGIDLGTTNLRVAVFRNGKLETIPNEFGNYTTSSCVAFADTLLIGDAAMKQAYVSPANTVFDAKCLMGRHSHDSAIIAGKKYWPFEVAERDGHTMIGVEYKGEKKEFFPEEIIALLLAKMKEMAEAYLGKPVTDAVITVPACFNNSQRQAALDASVIAGLNVLRIISEPVAAAVTYGFNKRKVEEILVFGLGGGFLGVAVLLLEQGIVEVRSTSGVNLVGGKDFDDCIVNYFTKEFKRKFKRDPSENKAAMCRLRSACVRAKTTLSSVDEACIEIDSFFEGISFCTKLSRARFEELCAYFFGSILESVERALRDAKFRKDEIEDVILVGGSSRIPKIQKILTDFFDGKELNMSMDPDEAVVYGAAIQAAILSGDRSEELEGMLLIDTTPFSLGIETSSQPTSDESEAVPTTPDIHTSGGMMTVLIKRNSSIPKKEILTVSTNSDNQCTHPSI